MVKIKNKKSSLADFIKKPIPTEKEIEKFDEYIDDKIRKEEIQESLTEIYKDESGKMIDVSKLDVKKSRGWLYKITISLIVLIALGLAAYAYYYLIFLNQSVKNSTLNIELKAAEETIAGKEFFYILELNNKEKAALIDMEIKLRYPDGFIFLDSEPQASLNNDTWSISRLAAHSTQQIKIKGKIISPNDETLVAFVDTTYTPENFSSEFKKSTSSEIVVKSIGMEILSEKSSSAFIGEENQITLSIKPSEDNFINNFLVNLEVPENFIILDSKELPENIEQKANKKNTFIISELGNEEINLTINFILEEKKEDNQNVTIKFDFAEETDEGTKYHNFYEEIIDFEVTKSDLNLSLFVNGSQSNQGVSQEDTINYLLNYANRGDSDLEDVIIMMVIEGDLVNWQSLQSDIEGTISNNTISWSKLEIPQLENLKKGEEGLINFSVNLNSFVQTSLPLSDSIKSYAQFSVGDKETENLTTNKSNTIINQINSDLSFKEEIRYFNDDNIAVGTGSLPPKVNEATSFKVYWTIENNLHELIGLQVNLPLPGYIKWDEKNRASIGQLSYNREEHKINWWIGRLPTTIYRADAEFNISFTPEEEDRNRIVVLLPGATATASDNETKTNITINTKAQTTQLKNDLIANTTGIVQ